MPICEGCSASFDDGYKFCPHCGRARPETSSTIEQEFVWEYCEIVFQARKTGGNWIPMRYRDVFFWANAIGINGSYKAGESIHYDLGNVGYGEHLPPLGSGEKELSIASDAHRMLVKQLINDGWEPTGALTDIWWRMKFRRKVKK